MRGAVGTRTSGFYPLQSRKSLKDEREAEVTREKLRSLEARYQAVSQDPGGDAHIQELTLRSLKRMINPMKEEIARYESRRSPRAGKSAAEVAST
jgi:hypothetical protein